MSSRAEFLIISQAGLDEGERHRRNIVYHFVRQSRVASTLFGFFLIIVFLEKRKSSKFRHDWMVFSTGGWVDWLNYHHLFYFWTITKSGKFVV